MNKSVPVVAQIPLDLLEARFIDAWNEWEAYKREDKRQRLTQRMVTKQLKFLSDMGVEAAIQSIEQSIRNGWQGLFFVKQESAKQVGFFDGLKDFVEGEL